MKKLTILSLAIAAVIAVFFIAYDFAGIRPTADPELSDIKLPPGFSISVFAGNLGSSRLASPGPNAGPRFMAYYGDVLLVSLMRQGRVAALPDRNGDETADEVITVAENLRNPHGLAVYDGELYVAEEDKVIKGNLTADFVLENITVVVEEIPAGGGHFTRTILIRNNTLYLSVGSSCNVCHEAHEWRASVLKCSLDGNCFVFASGLRNSVGLSFHPGTGELWATENGRDLIGNEIPPEEINIIREGNDYGWPVCYGNKIHDTDFDKNTYTREPCAGTEAPVFEMQAHSAPLGMAFYDGSMFPGEYKGDLFVAFHGSWNRQPPTGYKVVRISVENGMPVSVEDFASGWLSGLVVRGRPVDVIVAKDGALLVSDDNSGRIYRIAYSG